MIDQRSNLPCTVIQSFEIPKTQIWSVEYSNNGEYIAVSTFNKSIYVYTFNMMVCTFNIETKFHSVCELFI